MTVMKPTLVALSLAACLLPPLLAKDDSRPNVLFILTDDQSPFDFKFYNPQSTLDTPRLDQLASEGVIVDGAYHMGSFSGAVCTPSRHMIMTGRTLWHLPVGPDQGLCPPKIEEQTTGAIFKRAGFATMRTCKKGNSYAAANKQFEIVHDATKRGGTAETGSAWHADQVLDFLSTREKTADKKPFFIHFGFSHPHDTRDGTTELLEKYGATNHKDRNALPAANPRQPALPPNYLSAHPFDNTHMNVRDEVAVSGVWDNRDPQTIRNELGREYACSENIDIQIGRVLDKLEAMGELENTYIIYTADHGIAIGRHGLQGKQNLYEHTWRVPMIVKGPGIPAGKRVTGNVYLLDLLPTFCDLAGVQIPETVEGTSFKPVISGEKPIIRDTLYGAYCGGAKPGMRSVKQGDWKLIKYESADGKAHTTQLFNLADNPNELLTEHLDPKIIEATGIQPTPSQRNLAEDPAHAGDLKRMEALLLSEMRRLNDPWRFSNQPDDGLAMPEQGAKKPRRKKKQKAIK